MNPQPNKRIPPIKCPECKSKNMYHGGFVCTVEEIYFQAFKCLDCDHIFELMVDPHSGV